MNQGEGVLIIYTGGTIGMIKDHLDGSLKPFDFSEVSEHIPELQRFGFRIDAIQFDSPIDSSDIHPGFWVKIAEIIKVNYDLYLGFIVLHGTDTMAYSASALSFMMENLSKPIIFTGAQLPLGTLRTDGRENLITSIEIATSQENGKPIVPEVCIYFENKLYRGNRTTKVNAVHFNAFQSANYPYLAKAGVQLIFNKEFIIYPEKTEPLIVHKRFSDEITIIKLFPGINKSYMDAVLHMDGLKAVILETYGSGNAPSEKWFTSRIKKAVDRDIILLNVTQCSRGSVELGRYVTSRTLLESGVISGYDITTEAATTKLMLLLSQDLSLPEIKMLLNKSLKGEITPH